MKMKKNTEIKDELKKSFMYHLTGSLAKRPNKASKNDLYQAMALSIRDLMVEKWITTADAYEEQTPKSVYYLSLEYLIGRTLGNAMYNLQVFEAAKKAMAELGYDLNEVREEENDAGLGNGGLGRLAACFLDSMATLNLPAMGYGIRYDYGIFRQKIENGYQVEEPDNWLRFGNPWEICRTDRIRTVHFHGHTEPCSVPGKPMSRQWLDTEDVLAMPYDTPIPGYGTDNVNTLRLWSAKSLYDFNLGSFNQGDYLNANLNALLTENITRVLYPNDNNYEGKELRLKQQYFLVSATLQDIMHRFKTNYRTDIREFPQKVSIQLNDTHPAFAIPELMRILLDEEMLDWDEAWDICTRTFNYTNHTLMSEALEKWPVSMIAELLPRLLEIIYQINAGLMRKIANRYPGDLERLGRMSLIEEYPEKKVRMSYMAIIGSAKVNGVAALHTKLLKDGLFRDFYQYQPDKFINITNGITPRRWLLKANPDLAQLLTEKIGEQWITDLDQLRKINSFSEDPEFRQRIMEVKQTNKQYMTKYIAEEYGIAVNPNSIFDVQVKRLHEYKRQLLNVLHIISLYLELKDGNVSDFRPRTFIFGAKAAPGYYLAKMIIKLINSVADVVNHDDDIGDRLKVLFLPNYRVSLAEKIIPAADVSEQISLAGTEASGTGNMKFALNGALTVGTMDGANIEIHDNVGPENIFIFGLQVAEVEKLRAQGYNPHDYIERSPALKRVLELISSDFFCQQEPGLFKPIIESLDYDTYMIAADFDSYAEIQRKVAKTYADQNAWAAKSIANIANVGIFSSDRTVREYADKVWQIQPFKV